MSNKLYTKEDFLKAAQFCEVSMIDAKYIIERIDEVTDPIEIPSDEDIERELINHIDLYGFENSAKWMRDKYAEGYSEGYKRALELVKWKIDNDLQGGKNEQ